MHRPFLPHSVPRAGPRAQRPGPTAAVIAGVLAIVIAVIAPRPAQAAPAEQSDCLAGTPCLATPSLSGNAIVLSWTAERRYSYFRLSLAVTGSRDTIRQTVGGTRIRYLVRPYRRDTVYTFKVQGCDRPAGGQARCTPWSNPVRISTVTVTATPANTCPGTPTIETFGVSPDTIILDESATLSWGFVQNADRVEIDGGIGGVATPGSLQVQPARTTTYRLTATGCGGTLAREATVRVQVNAPSGGFPSSEEPEGFSPQLTWVLFGLDPSQEERLPGGAYYDIEIEIERRGQEGQFELHERNELLVGATEYTNIFAFPEDTLRVKFKLRARSRSADSGLEPSAWAESFRRLQ
jgi:hypothetical protein